MLINSEHIYLPGKFNSLEIGKYLPFQKVYNLLSRKVTYLPSYLGIYDWWGKLFFFHSEIMDRKF